LLAFFNQHNLITPCQHGFLAKHSTCTNLLESVDDWTSILDDKKSIDVAYLDFSKAFDSVSLPKLVHKLAYFGIIDPLLSCLRSFLTERRQCVCISNTCSSYLPIISGVPQGSVLGPILFLVYINDLPPSLGPSSVAKVFADDVKHYNSPAFLHSSSAFQQTLDSVSNWSAIWQLKLSVPKCKILHVSYQSADLETFNVGGVPLESVLQIKDLGVIVDSRLSFTQHIDAVVGRAKQRLYLLFKCFVSRDITLLTIAYKTYVLPILEYCSPIWSPYKLSSIDHLEAVQRYFTKRLYGLWDEPYSTRLVRCGLNCLELRRVKADLHLCYKIINGLVALKLLDFFEPDQNHVLRGNKQKLKLPRHRLDVRLHTFSSRVIPMWNALPNEVILAESFVLFKHKLDRVDLSAHLRRNYEGASA
jgi:ribonucleases P/MRP protein subunit RPP40